MKGEGTHRFVVWAANKAHAVDVARERLREREPESFERWRVAAVKYKGRSRWQIEWMPRADAGGSH